jgi:hypothetical protein
MKSLQIRLSVAVSIVATALAVLAGLWSFIALSSTPSTSKIDD